MNEYIRVKVVNLIARLFRCMHDDFYGEASFQVSLNRKTSPDYKLTNFYFFQSENPLGILMFRITDK